MQINLPEDTDELIRQKAAAAGFGDQIEAYVVHLIAADDREDYAAPADLHIGGRTREEIDAMLDEGLASGEPSPMTDEDWRLLHERIGQRTAGESPADS